MDSFYRHKYLKYKTKYLQMCGGNGILPVLELYQFELKGYPDSNKPTKFRDFIDSPKETCGHIDSDQEGDFKKDQLSSCDVITQKGGVYTLPEWYENYTKWQTKFWDKDIKYSGKEPEVEKLIDEIIKMNKDYIMQNGCSLGVDFENDDLDKGGFVFKINVKNTDKIIIFGDHHGSFHTFFRNMVRLHRTGVLNLDTFKVNDGYKLIFLGDLVDRGKYATEILLILFNLMKNSNTSTELRAILNRGNHEELKTLQLYGFQDELVTKFPKTNDFPKAVDFRKKFLSVFGYCSSAIIIENESNQRFWMSHGGFPITNITLDGKNIKSYNLVDYNSDIKIWYYNAVKTDFPIPTQIRWNDFMYSDKIYGKKNSDRGECNCFALSNRIVSDFLKKNNIQFIIRAHQDSYANSWLLSSHEMKSQKGDFDGVVIDEIRKIKSSSKVIINPTDAKIEGRSAVFGPIARVKLDGFVWTEDIEITYENEKEAIYPVITLSTNTDLDRPLVHDSFAVLRFDLNDQTISNFDTRTNLLDPRKDLVPVTNLF